MFRSKSNDDSDHSDDEKSRLPRHNDSDDDEMSAPKRRKANTVWNDVLMEQSLESKSSSFSINSGTSAQLVSRGAETYDVPADLLKPGVEIKVPNPIVAITPANDNPFADPVDLSTVEEFGVKGNDPSREGKRDSNGRGGRGRGGFMRGRGRGNQHNHGNKRRYQPTTKNVSLSQDYSLEALMATEFTNGLSDEDLGKEIALALGEKDPEAIMKVVKGIGSEKSLAIFDETRQVESSGGMKVMDGSRRRTPGGVFIMLVKSDMDIPPEIKDEMFQQTKMIQRKIQRAQRKTDHRKNSEPTESSDYSPSRVTSPTPQ